MGEGWAKSPAIVTRYGVLTGSAQTVALFVEMTAPVVTSCLDGRCFSSMSYQGWK